MAKRKRRQSDNSDSGSSYKHEESETEEVQPSKARRQTRASTAKHLSVETTAPVPEARGSIQSPGKLLAAINSLNDTNQLTPPPTGENQAAVISTPKPSPRKKQKTSSPRKKIPDAKPEAEWRASDIPADLNITKGNAQKLFRLSAADLNDSDLQFRQMTRGSLKGSMHLYNMRAVERLAWRKYGSPEGFDTVLENAKALWISKGNDPRIFPRIPRPYRSYTQGKCKQCNELFSMPSNVLVDKCPRCRGIIPRPSLTIERLEVADWDDFNDQRDVDPGEYDEDDYDHGGGCPCEFFGLG